MATFNETCLNTLLQTQINKASLPDTSTCILVQAMSGNVLANNRQNISVGTSANLPDIPTSKIGDGHLIYVESIARPVISSCEQWIGLDGRLYRDDTNLYTVWSSGSGAYGVLGDCTTVSKSSPVSVVGGFTNWCAISSGQTHAAAIRINGTAWAWGRNLPGTLGDGTTVARSSPVSVIGGVTNWCAIYAGNDSTAALRTDGTAWGWGKNQYGQLGDNTTVCKSSPVSVIGGFTNWCAISSSFDHIMALRTDGTAWGWGCGFCGRLGNNAASNVSSPVSVVGGFTNWCAISAGTWHTAALRTDGTAWSWGSGGNGRHGDGAAATNRSSPVSVIGGFTDWCKISASHLVIALRTNGTAWTWGCGACGKLGNNTTVDKSSPVSVVGGFTNWCAISAGCNNSAALRTDGTIWTWGCNNQGGLGDGTTVDKSSPISVVGGFTNWSAVSAVGNAILAIRSV